MATWASTSEDGRSWAAYECEAVDWEAFYREFDPPLRAFVRRRVPPGLVDDTVQDAFVRAFRSRYRVDWTGPVWPWLVTMAWRACIETLRVEGRTPVPVEAAGHDVVAEDVHSHLEQEQRRRAILTAFATLAPRHRRLLARWEVNREPYASIAADEGVSLQALKSALARARARFRVAYAAAAEKAGLLVGVVVGRWSRARLRPERLDARLLDASLSGIALLVAGIVVASSPVLGDIGHGVPAADVRAAQPASAEVGAAAPGAATASVPAVARPGAPTADGPGGGSGEPAGRPGPVDVRGRTGIDIDDSGSTTADLDLEGEIPVASGTYGLQVPVTCRPGLKDAFCGVLRSAGDNDLGR